MGAENELDLESLKALAEKATPGPWYPGDGNCTPFGVHGRHPNIGHVWVADTYVDGAHNAGADSAFIAAFNPQTVLALIAALEAERAEVARLRDVGRDVEPTADQVERASVAILGVLRNVAFTNRPGETWKNDAWDTISEEAREEYRACARAALRAGAPQQKGQQP